MSLLALGSVKSDQRSEDNINLTACQEEPFPVVAIQMDISISKIMYKTHR